MSYKAIRKLKVYQQSGYLANQTPQIRLQGKWLDELGFSVGVPINVECRGGQIVITRADEVIAEGISCDD